MNNLHITLNSFTNASRITKQTRSIIEHNIADNIYIAALHEDNLPLEQRDGERIVANRFPLKTRKLNKSLFMQIIKYIEFCYKVTKFYKHKNIKMINIHMLQVLPLGVFLKYYYGATLVYDTHELETEQVSGKSLRKTLSKIVERLCIKRADIIFVVSESIAKWYESTYNIPKPVVVYNAPKYKEVAKSDKFRESLPIKQDSIIMLYQGGFMRDRGLELWIEAFKQRADDKVVLVFMGYGEMQDEIEKAATESDNIFFHPAVEVDVLLSYTAAAAAAVSYIFNSCLNYLYCMPNKLFEYTMAGLPVIVSNLKDMSDVVREYNLGIVVDMDTPEAINKAVDTLIAMDLSQFRENARKFAQTYCWEQQESKMIAEYRRVISSNNTRSVE